MRIRVSNITAYNNHSKVIDKLSIETVVELLNFELVAENTRRIQKQQISLNGIKPAEIKSLLYNLFSFHFNLNDSNIYLKPNSSSQKEGCIIVKGENTIYIKVQLANWALLYKDFFEFIHLEEFKKYKQILYITADSNLCNLLSSGIVNYKKAERLFGKFEHLIEKKEILLVGINYDKL